MDFFPSSKMKLKQHGSFHQNLQIIHLQRLSRLHCQKHNTLQKNTLIDTDYSIICVLTTFAANRFLMLGKKNIYGKGHCVSQWAMLATVCKVWWCGLSDNIVAESPAPQRRFFPCITWLIPMLMLPMLTLAKMSLLWQQHDMKTRFCQVFFWSWSPPFWGFLLLITAAANLWTSTAAIYESDHKLWALVEGLIFFFLTWTIRLLFHRKDPQKDKKRPAGNQ